MKDAYLRHKDGAYVFGKVAGLLTSVGLLEDYDGNQLYYEITYTLADGLEVKHWVRSDDYYGFEILTLKEVTDKIESGELLWMGSQEVLRRYNDSNNR